MREILGLACLAMISTLTGFCADTPYVVLERADVRAMYVPLQSATQLVQTTAAHRAALEHADKLGAKP